MKKKNVTIALVAFLMFGGTAKLSAQDSTSTEKKSFSTWLTKTPWIVGFGGDIVLDNPNGGYIRKIAAYDYYPAKFTAEKVMKKGWSAQFSFASTSLRPHSFLSIDLNAKYDFNNLIGETKWFDPYGVLGLGYSYSDAKPLVVGGAFHSANLNIGAGANFWLFPNMGLNAQGLAKFGPNTYLQASLGLVFKIGNSIAPKCEATPKTQEAQDALQHLRGIINK